MIYTFWFHPMATNPQLLSGFFYMFLLFTQLMLAWTPLHLDKRWIVLFESYVAILSLVSESLPRGYQYVFEHIPGVAVIWVF
jgi:hypothetical protein